MSRARTYSMEYVGFAIVDKIISNPMIPWIIAQILRGANRKKVDLYIEGNSLVCRNCEGLVFSHPLELVSRPSLLSDPMKFIYLLRDPKQPLLQVHLFNTTDPDEVLELVTSMKETSSKMKEPPRSLSNASTLTTLCPDISPSSSHFFEVLYIGRIKVSHKKVPDTYIDDALDKFHKFEKEKKERESLVNNNQDNYDNGSGLQIITNGKTSASYGSTEMLRHSDTATSDTIPKILTRKRSGSAGSVLIKKPENLSVAAAAMQDHNRTMVFQVGRTDLRLISPDRKQVIIHKHLKDITHSIQGLKHDSHFAFICKEAGMEQGGFVGYVFKGQSASVAEDVVTAISQAVQSDWIKKSSLVSCDHCPMVWYHRLCTEVEGLGPGAAQTAVAKRLEALPPEEQSGLAVKLQGALEGLTSPSEQAETLMMVLRAHCESKQARHLHDTPENRHEFLNHYLGGGTIFMKAKRSLTNSFDQLLKRKGSKDDFGPIIKELSLPANATLCKDNGISSSGDESSSQLDGSSESDEKAGSMMNIFLKVGNSPSKSHEEVETDENHERPASWRQAIFNNVVTPSKALQAPKIVKRDKEFYRELWKKAINQQVLLIRMEKENARLTARQEEANVKRIKLEYDDLSVVENSEVWDVIVSRDCDKRFVTQALKQGIPKGKRGEVWMELADKYKSGQPPFDSSKFPNYGVSYDSLLKQLTSHQHAILIDLGRTFPNHVYYSSPLGPGQLALFNILKAYSLLDPEVGYCQGLSFIAGVLLLHMSEEQAFVLLRHLMLDVGLRACYLPDMAALQVSLYQLSRLLHDHLPQLYSHLDKFEVSPTLYAAPWLLTIFSSQFPLGFVTRVFDVIFADSTDVLFRVALTLLNHHKDGLLACDSFELIMDYLKNKLPDIDRNALDKMMKEVVSRDISRELWDYGVEYHVLQEEMSSPRPEAKRVKQLEAQNKELNAKNKALSQQLQIASSNISRLEASRTNHMTQMNRLEAEVRGMEVTVATLGEFIQSLAYSRSDIEIPSEILRILAQVSHLQMQQRPKHKLNTNRGVPLRVLDDNKPPLKFALSTPNLKVSNLFGQNRSQSGKSEEQSGLKKSLSDAEGSVRLSPARELVKSKSTERLDVARFGRVLTEQEMKVLKVVKEDTQQMDKRRELKSSQSSMELKTHPLDCDSGVPILFEGTTKLKCIKSTERPRCYSENPSLLKIIEQPTDPVGAKIKSTMDKVSQLFDASDPLFPDSQDLFINPQPSTNKTGLLT